MLWCDDQSDKYLDPKPKFSGEGGVFLLSRKNLNGQSLNTN